MSLGFGNWIALKLFGRRLYRDHYEPSDRRDRPAARALEEEQAS
jgi:hypothetical protein